MPAATSPSIVALRILAAPPDPCPDRSLPGLLHVRARAKARATADVPRILGETGVTVRACVIGGVPCMELEPRKRVVRWPVLYGFGGGFVQGSPIEDLSISAPLCAATGARMIVPDYRLAPEHPWPAAVEDCVAVYSALAHAPFAVVGESAGGNLMLVLMARARAAGLRLPGAAALLSPWCDLGNGYDSTAFNDGRDPVLSARASAQAAAHYAGAHPVTDPGISPIHARFDAGVPPLIITTGTRDLHLGQAMQLAKVLQQAGTEVDLQVWGGLWHVFEWYDHLPEARQSIQLIAAHLVRAMRG